MRYKDALELAKSKAAKFNTLFVVYRPNLKLKSFNVLSLELAKERDVAEMTSIIEPSGKIHNELNEGDVIHTKFGQRLGQKKGMYHNPDLEPPVDLRTGESFVRFYMEPAGKNTGIIYGVHENGDEVRIAGTRRDVAEMLTKAYNAGGYTDQDIKKVPLTSHFKDGDKDE